ncbi:MAG: DNA alkylation repair protein [Gemmataceae bacterium]
MTAAEVLTEIEPLGTEQYRKVLRNHGVTDACFGVKIEDLKKVQKRVKTDYQLALDLYATGICDAQYLAGLVADDARMTKADLRRWVAGAGCDALCQYTVAWVATGSKHGRELALEWIDAKKERTAVAGWATLGCLVAVVADADLDLAELTQLLARVEKAIHDEPDRVRYAMNGFVIAAGSYVAPLHDAAVATAKRIGRVTVDMGDTACKVPYAPEYIAKAVARGVKKRKTVKC